MIVRPAQIRATYSFLLPTASSSIQNRCLHLHVTPPRIPQPTPFVPDAQTFLTLIGRNLSQHASKIPTWEALFSLRPTQLRELGIEPPRSRRYLLRWREKFRNGQYGICGDAQFVVDGTAHLRVVEVPRADGNASAPTSATATMTPGTRKMIVNIPPEEEPSDIPLEQLKPIRDLKLKGSHTITGPYVQPVKGFGGKAAKIVVVEGLWEDKRGHKIDGGERRQAEVRAKRRSEERKTTRG
jgi:hypothetical protein